MANYADAYKYKSNGSKLGEYLQRGIDIVNNGTKITPGPLPSIYYPNGANVFQTVCGEFNNSGSSPNDGLCTIYSYGHGESSFNFYTTPCVLGVSIADLTNYSTLKIYPSGVTIAPQPGLSTPIGMVTTVNSPQTVDQMRAGGFDTVILGAKIYDNSNDGNYSATNKRGTFPQNKYDYGVICCGLISSSLGGRQFEPFSQKWESYDTPVNQWWDLIRFLNCGMEKNLTDVRTLLPSSQTDHSTIFYMFGDIFNECVITDGTINDTAPYTKNGYVVDPGAWQNITTMRRGLVCNRKKLTDFLNLFGIPFTYDTANILTTNTDDFTDGYKPSGQPENPTGGGDGAGDNSSDEMVFPTVQITPTNVFSRLSCCTTAELNKLSNFIFTATFFDNIKLLTNEPLEALCNVMYLPFDIHGHSNCSDIHTLTLMNVVTPANVYDLSPNYNMVLNMGSITVEPYYNTYLDYSPNTEIEIYLPYKGFVNLSVNDIMGKTLTVKYIMDMFSGAATIVVLADTQVVHISSAQIGINIPISQSNANSRASNLIGAAVGTVGSIATGAVAGATVGAMGGVVGGAAGGIIGGMGAAANGVSHMLNAAQNHVDKGGAFGGMGWLYAPQKCYLIYNRPISAEPKLYKSLNGYSTSYSGTISAYSGFLQAEIINGTTAATDTENDMIFNLIRGGIYV